MCRRQIGFFFILPCLPGNVFLGGGVHHLDIDPSLGKGRQIVKVDLDALYRHIRLLKNSVQRPNLRLDRCWTDEK